MKSKNIMYLSCGLPGAGKTTLAKQIENDTNAIRTCTDEWIDDLGMDMFDVDIHDKLQSKLYLLALKLLGNGQDVILEDGLWTKAERDEKLFDARRLGAMVYINVFNLSFEEQWRRLNNRNNNPVHGTVPISIKQLKSYSKIFEPPDKHELAIYDKARVYYDDSPLVYSA